MRPLGLTANALDTERNSGSSPTNTRKERPTCVGGHKCGNVLLTLDKWGSFTHLDSGALGKTQDLRLKLA